MSSMSTVYRISIIFSMLCLIVGLNHHVFANPAQEKTLKFGVLSIAQPSRIFKKWQPFTDYIGSRLDQKVEIVVPRGFGKMKQAIEKGEVDFFYINSHVFYRLKQQGKAIGVAQMMNIENSTTSKSEIFVRKDSNLSTLQQLKNKNVAFVSPMGAGGYLAPRSLLYQNGIESGVDNRESFTKNLSNSIHGVLLGDYDAGTMCGVNYELMSEKIETGELMILAVSEAYPENVIGARPDLDDALINRFRTVVIAMEDESEGMAILDDMKSSKIKRFLPYDSSIEKITENLLEISRLK